MELLTVTEVSALLGIPEGTLRWWRARGEGPRAFKLGHRVLYRRIDIEHWVSSQYDATATGGAAPPPGEVVRQATGSASPTRPGGCADRGSSEGQ